MESMMISKENTMKIMTAKGYCSIEAVKLDIHQVDIALKLYTKTIYLFIYVCGYLYDIDKYKDTNNRK